METYQQDELADSEKDVKQIEEAEKAVELKNRHKRKQGSDKEMMEPQQPSGSGRHSFRAVLVFHRLFHSCHPHLTSQCHFRSQQAQQSGYLGPVYSVCRWGT